MIDTKTAITTARKAALVLRNRKDIPPADLRLICGIIDSLCDVVESLTGVTYDYRPQIPRNPQRPVNLYPMSVLDIVWALAVVATPALVLACVWWWVLQ